MLGLSGIGRRGAGLKRRSASVAALVLAGCAFAGPGRAQNYPPPGYSPPGALPGAPGGPPILMQQAPPDPRQFCYYNGQPYSMGAPYPANTPGPNGRPMRCRATAGMINGAVMLEWSDEN